MKLTKLERKLIDLYSRDHFKDELGDPVWIDGYAQDMGISGKAFSGVMSSMVQKGLVYTNGESFGLTEKGIEMTETL
jgi:hypothetical protein